MLVGSNDRLRWISGGYITWLLHRRVDVYIKGNVRITIASHAFALNDVSRILSPRKVFVFPPHFFAQRDSGSLRQSSMNFAVKSQRKAT